MSFNTFDFGQVKVSFKGIMITGFAQDSSINVERTADAFTMVAGATGDITRVRNRDKSGMVTLTLMAESASNDLLSAAALEDEIFGTGVGELFIEDKNGNTIIAAPQAWIQKMPATGFAGEASTREWVIACAELEMNVGGSLTA